MKTLLSLIFILLGLSVLAVQDQNPQNNIFTRNISVIGPMNMTILYVPTKINGTLPIDADNFQNNIEEHTKFIKKLYPVSNDSLQVTIGDVYSIDTETADEFYFDALRGIIL